MNDTSAATGDVGDALLTANGVSKHFGGRKVLDDVSLCIRRGKILTLIGPNGAGKTTLIRIALGLMTADSGSITRRRGLRVGYMPQRMPIDPVLPLTVARFLQLARATRGAEGNARRARKAEVRATRAVPSQMRAAQSPQTTKPAPATSATPAAQSQQVLARLGIAHLAARQLLDISGGELQRVLLARALMGAPDLLILDEPAQGVDLSGQAELYHLIAALSAETGCGVLMISHDLHLVMSATDEVVCLNHHVCCHGKPEQVSSDPSFLDLFGAQVSQEMAVYTHQHTHEHDLAGEIIGDEGDNGASHD